MRVFPDVPVVDCDSGIDRPVYDDCEQSHGAGDVPVLGGVGATAAKTLAHDDDVLVPVENLKISRMKLGALF